MSSTNALLICASLSLLSCSIVVISIGFDPTSSTSRHLGLVFNLLLSGMGLSLALVIYSLVATSDISNETLQSFCNIFLPFPIYFFLCSFGWTILIAFKFRSSKSWFLPAENKIIVPFYTVWVTSFVIILPVIVIDIAYPDLVSIPIDSSTTNMCVFNHASTTGKIIDVLCLQLPLTLTILINLYSYSRGLWALRDSPHSVLAKNMRKAGGYLLILLVVFIPNIVYSYYALSQGTNSGFQAYLDFAFCLSALQGFLNVIVYVLSNPDMLSWIYKILSCQKPWSSEETVQRRTEGSDSSTKGPTISPMATTVDFSISIDDLASRNSFSIEAPAPAPTPAPSATKGILQSGKGTKSWLVSNLDQEKFVRFGEVTTRYISEAERASMSSINDLQHEPMDPYRESDDRYRDEY